MDTKDYYMILGITRAESPSGIREAFRELAKRYHPDRVGAQGTTFFQEIVEAYEVLSDPERRTLYNRGLQHAEGGESWQAEPIIMGQAVPPEPLVPEPLQWRHFSQMRPSREALLDRLRRNFTGRNLPKGERLEALTIEIILSPDEALRGRTLLIGVPVFYPCPMCNGSGRDWLFPCVYCQQQGMVEEAETVRIHIPPLVQDGAVVALPLRGLGIHNVYVRVLVRVADAA
jgi:DnaJ-class molecular chaperone